MGARRKKFVIVGDGSCGKTCLLMVFAKGGFPTDYVPTVFETYITDLEVDDQKMELVLYDTAGQEDYDRLRPMSYVDADAVVVCYSVDSPDSLMNVTHKWIKEVQHFCPKAPIIFVGNKADLRSDRETIEKLSQVGKKPVTYQEARKVSDQIKSFVHLECSAKTGEGVRDIFIMASRASMMTKEIKKRKCEII